MNAMASGTKFRIASILLVVVMLWLGFGESDCKPYGIAIGSSKHVIFALWGALGHEQMVDFRVLGTECRGTVVEMVHQC